MIYHDWSVTVTEIHRKFNWWEDLHVYLSEK